MKKCITFKSRIRAQLCSGIASCCVHKALVSKQSGKISTTVSCLFDWNFETQVCLR